VTLANHMGRPRYRMFSAGIIGVGYRS